jgi:hypothetical protein
MTLDDLHEMEDSGNFEFFSDNNDITKRVKVEEPKKETLTSARRVTTNNEQALDDRWSKFNF